MQQQAGAWLELKKQRVQQRAHGVAGKR